jgi:hypothetical protein
MAAAAKPTAVSVQATLSRTWFGTNTAKTRCSGCEMASATAAQAGTTGHNAMPSKIPPRMWPATNTTEAVAVAGRALTASSSAAVAEVGVPMVGAAWAR